MQREQHEQHTWERERRRDGSSEFPSTSFSTTSSELRDSTMSKPRPRPRRRRYLKVLLPFVLMLAASLLGLLAMAKHFHH